MPARLVRLLARSVVDAFALLAGAPLIAIGAVVGLMPGVRRRPPTRARILFSSRPIRALALMAESARRAGYDCEVAVRESPSLYAAEHFDHVVTSTASNPVVHRFVSSVRAYVFFARALVRFQVFASYFDGGVLRATALGRLEWPLLRMLGKRLVLFPYGSDAWALDQTPNALWRAAVQIDYPDTGRQAARVQSRLRRGCRHADCVLGCLVHVVALPRWDVLPLTCYPIDTEAFESVPPRTTGTVRIAHSANHRGFKGTDFLVAAVGRLRARGYDVELDVIERAANEEALRRVAEADVYVDQLVAGYAFAALEAMVLGKVVVSPTTGDPTYEVFRRYSYLAECPLVDASPETIESVLADLIDRRHEWPERGRAGRDYCERRHSLAANAEMWTAILRRVWMHEDVDLINLYHPLQEAGLLER